MERLDSRERLPRPMEKYLSLYGWRFTKRLCEIAVSKMKGRDGKRITPYTKEDVELKLKQFGLMIDGDMIYDAVYVANMAKADYLGSSLANEQQLFLFVKDYLTDPDGDPTRALDEYVARSIGMGSGIDWEDYL